MAEELYVSCSNDVMPTIHTMCIFGLDGAGGTNPVDVFQHYRTAFGEGLTPYGLQHALETGTISECIGTDVVFSPMDCVECTRCARVHNNDSQCPNCSL